MSERPRLSCVLFDIDGTLIDTTDLIAAGLQHAVRKHRGRTPDRARCVELIGRPLLDQFRLLAGEPVAPLVADFIRYYERHRHLERVIAEAVALVGLARGLGLQVGVVTSKNHTELANSLPRLGIAPLLSVAICAGDAPRPKPAPDPILAALERLGAEAGRTLYLGDTEWDLQAGRAAGVLTGAAAWAATHPDRLRAAGPDFWFDRPDQAADLLRQAAPEPTAPGSPGGR